MLSNDCAVIKPLANGSESQDLLSQEEAFAFLASAIKQGLIDRADRARITDEITGSRLRKVLSLNTRLLLEMADTLKDIRGILDQEFGGLPPDSFSSNDEATPDDLMRIPGNQTIH